MTQIASDIAVMQEEERFVQNMIDSDLSNMQYSKLKSLEDNHFNMVKIQRVGEQANYESFLNPETAR